MRKRRPKSNPMRGLGDLVAVVAQPIAKGIDHVFGTDIQHCKGCMSRQSILNHLVPFKGTPLPPSSQ